ncbi:MAG TPA: hypothetical protein VK731_13400, partial [Candidatus Cybelea sp.]|nr:hypothetical protein [Candidatus Cybelea sp.]
MKKGFPFITLLLLIGLAFWFYDRPKKPAPGNLGLATQNTSSLLPRKSTAIPAAAGGSALTNATSVILSPNPSPAPAPQAGELKPDESANTPVGPDTALQHVRHAVHQ